MNILLYQVDSFTSTPFRGNPAGVCILEKPMPDEWMQAVASEMNLSETAFIQQESDDNYNLRWFTPSQEVSLCGHATLASAHIMHEQGLIDTKQEIVFSTLSGELKATHTGDLIQMNFPARPVSKLSAHDTTLEILNLPYKSAGASDFDYFVELESEEQIINYKPDIEVLKLLPLEGLIITAGSENPTYDFISRYFAPKLGIDEDPVTGSAHCSLAPYWSKILGRTEMKGYQASKRGGEVITRLDGKRVILFGSAVTIMECRLLNQSII